MTVDLTKKMSEDFKAIGIKAGDTILVHSSLSALGDFPDKARTITEALVNVLTEKGTLLMPSLTYKSVTKENPVFNLNETPSCVGGLTEFFRTQPGVVRSLHPTHSVCAFGRNSSILTASHLNDNTPCGENSPFNKMRYFYGKILFLGCSLNTNTSMHGVEELHEPPYLYGGNLEYSLHFGNGKKIQKKYRTHDFKGFGQRYERVLNVLAKEDYRIGKVLMANACVMNSVAVWDVAQKKLCENPFYFVEKQHG